MSKRTTAFNDSGIQGILDSPMLREAHTIRWFAATGIEHTWIEVNKVAGHVFVHGYSAVEKSGRFVTSHIPAPTLSARVAPEDMLYRADQRANVHLHQYAIHHALLAAKEACARNDNVLSQAIIESLIPSVPWLGDMLRVATRLHGENAMHKMDEAMRQSPGWAMGEMLVSNNGPIDPWIRTFAMMTLLQNAHETKKPALYAFDTTDNTPGMYLWSNPPGIPEVMQILLDENLRPLLVVMGNDWRANGYGSSAKHTATQWGLGPNDATTRTFNGWKKCVKNHPKHDSKWFELLSQVEPRTLDAETIAKAARAWAIANPQPPTRYTPASIAKFAFNTWLVEQWSTIHPALHFALQSLATPMVLTEEDNLASVEDTRLAIGALHRQYEQTQEIEVLPLPELNDAPVVT